jgi:histidinol dehydrogenase
MMRVVDLRTRHLTKRGYQELLPRAPLDINSALETVNPIIESVKNGDESTLLALSEKFDGVAPRSLRVPQEVIEEALSELDSQLRSIIVEAIRRVRIVHRDQQRGTNSTKVVDGGEVTERWVPVDRVGLYVPGGKAVYPSSVIMNVVPAQIAGV